MANNTDPMEYFAVVSSLEYRGFDDAAPVVYDTLTMLICLDPHCSYVLKVTDSMTLASLIDEASKHREHKHRVLGRDG